MSEVRQGHVIDLLRAMRAESVHCAISSPPYWSLRAYGTEPQVWGDGWRGELGLEPTPELYVEHVVEVFREVKRVLRSDGTLWLNMGDGYWGGKGQSAQAWSTGHTDRDTLQGAASQITGMGETRPSDGKHPTIKPKDLIGMPWRVALALQADGWYWRSCIPWLKRNSMPESVTDRPGNAVEYWLLLTKSARYFYDAEAVRMPPTQSTIARVALAESRKAEADTQSTGGRAYKHCESARVSNEKYGGGRDHLVCAPPPGGRSRRNSDWFFESWQGLLTGEDGEPLAMVVNPKGFAEAHFATFPEKVVEPFVLASTSGKGCCPTCGAPWARAVSTSRVTDKPRPKDAQCSDRNTEGYRWTTSTRTLGWQPTCECEQAEPVPCTVLDPFVGSGTVLVVAQRLGRNGIGLELKPEYVDMARKRLAKPVTQEMFK